MLSFRRSKKWQREGREMPKQTRHNRRLKQRRTEENRTAPDIGVLEETQPCVVAVEEDNEGSTDHAGSSHSLDLSVVGCMALSSQSVEKNWLPEGSSSSSVQVLQESRPQDSTSQDDMAANSVSVCESNLLEDGSSSSSPELIEYSRPKRKKKKQKKDKCQIGPLGSDSSSDSNLSDDSILSHSGSFSSLSSERHECTREPSRSSGSDNESDEDQAMAEKVNTLCPCTKMSVSDVVYMTVCLGLRHSLTWDAQLDILKLVGTIYGEDSMPTTKSQYLDFLKLASEAMTFHIYCNVCETYLGVKTDFQENMTQCKNDLCKETIDISSVKNYFLSISIAHQLQLYLKDPEFVNDILTYRFQRMTSQSEYSDIYDGSIYRNLFENGGILSDPFNFSYTYFTDGIAFGRASNKTLWPIYITINELPYEKRAKYLILAGLYVGPHDPNLQQFMKPFVEQANHLSTIGVSWVHNNQIVHSKVVPLCCVADSVARCKLLNFQMYGATYGCTFCYQKTVHTKAGRKYAFSGDKPSQEERRTGESTMTDLKQVYKNMSCNEKDWVVRGVKGVTPLIKLKYFNFSPANFVVDYMHSILIGQTSAHLALILEPARKKFWLLENQHTGMDHIINTVDNRLLLIQSCSSIIRQLRPLKDRALWRASEYKSWLLFYFYPCCTGYLKRKHIVHFGMLSRATYILLQKKCSMERLAEAHQLLMQYTEYYQKYFGIEYMRYNVHLLSHAAECVENFGPLWGVNSFIYEAQNRYIKQLAKNPNTVILEIAKKFLIYQSLPILAPGMATSLDTVNFAAKLHNYKHRKNYLRSEEGYGLLGGGKRCVLSPEELRSLYHCAESTAYYKCYQRIIIMGRKYCTSFYCEGKKNNDSCLLTLNREIFVIKHILLSLTSNVFLIGVVLPECSTDLAHIKEVKGSGEVKCIQGNQVLKPCILMNVGSSMYVSCIPYGCSEE